MSCCEIMVSAPTLSESQGSALATDEAVDPVKGLENLREHHSVSRLMMLIHKRNEAYPHDNWAQLPQCGQDFIVNLERACCSIGTT